MSVLRMATRILRYQGATARSCVSLTAAKSATLPLNLTVPYELTGGVGGELLLSPQSVEIIKFGEPGSGR